MQSPLLSTLIRRLHLSIRQRLHADLQARGHTTLTAAHMYVFQSPGPDGLRPTELAARTNMTKQAMNHLLAGLERDGYLTRKPIPGDGRGTVLRLTKRGRDVVRIMHESSAAVENEWADRLGKAEIERLRAALAAVDRLEPDPERGYVPPDALLPTRQTSMASGRR